MNLTVAEGGQGKPQFALQTQHLIENGRDWNVVVCAGSAGGLNNDFKVGDVVVATETIEHNTKWSVGKAPRRFCGSAELVSNLRGAGASISSFRTHFAAIASGDEDVISQERRQDLRESTGASAVAWEGAGGTKAAEFSTIPFVEIIGISDMADQTLGTKFIDNLPMAMRSVAELVIAWSRVRSG